MVKGLNFRTEEGQKEYHKAYTKSLELFSVPVSEQYVDTSFGKTHLLLYGNAKNPPLVLLHAASCGATIWYPNMKELGDNYLVIAIDLISESSKSILLKKIKSPFENAQWLNETLNGICLKEVYLCGLSIGGWTAVNYAGFHPNRVKKLILLSPIQTFAKMHLFYFCKLLKMGFSPTRKNVEDYIGWGTAVEEPLPDSIIKQFTISVMNISANTCFPKWIKQAHLKKLTMPVLLLFGKNEFAFSVTKACKRAKRSISNLEIEVIENASHLLSISAKELINKKIKMFL